MIAFAIAAARVRTIFQGMCVFLTCLASSLIIRSLAGNFLAFTISPGSVQPCAALVYIDILMYYLMFCLVLLCVFAQFMQHHQQQNYISSYIQFAPSYVPVFHTHIASVCVRSFFK